MYNNSSTQYPNSGYPATTYQEYSTNYGSSGYGYQGYEQYAANQQQQTQQPTTGQWTTTSYGSTQKDAVAQEMQQQKAQLIKQREDYVRKVSVLRRELDQLRVQKQELIGDGHHGSNILRENNKLQEEIQGKMKAIQNVIEMLSSIIKDGQSISDLEAMLASKDEEKPNLPTTSYQESNHKQHKKETTVESKYSERYNYVHYDTGLHWCRLCDDFPETAKDYLLHLQDKDHRQMAKENDVDNTPWHKVPPEPVLPSDEDAPTKRIPIKGLQFFISAPSWYCKLCDIWIGDLHCASHHLKSQAHFQNYENFVAQNPHWEMEWLKDRETALTRKTQNSSDSDEPEKKKKRRKDKKHSHELSSAKDKKRKKRSKKHRKQSSDSSSSSSSSDSSSDDERSDRSKSIRVAMRNMKQVQSIMEEDLSSKWSVLEKLVEEHKKKQEIEKQEKEREVKESSEDPLINQWMTVTSTHDKDRQLLESLKDRMKQKQEQERIKQAEFEKKKREKEREDLERLQLKLKQEKEAAEEAELERKRKEQEEYERIRDKERNQVRFKPNTNYRKRRSNSRSDDEDELKSKYREERSSKERHESKRSRSRSVDRKMDDSNDVKKKPPGPPSYKKLPFIGRMPLFKNKKTVAEEREEKKKEIQKESYDPPPRRTRFEPGNLPRAFIPRPDVVCFPKLSSIPPLTIPPPPTVSEKVEPPEPPTISKPKIQKHIVEEEPQAPPPPKLDRKEEQMNLSDDEVLYANPGEGMDPSMMGQYYQDYQNMMYSSHDMYSYQDNSNDVESSIPHSHTMPLQPPPLPPDDDLALLGICADDMAAQSF